MKKISIALGCTFLLLLSNAGFAEKNQENISFSAIFSSSSEFVDDFYPETRFVDYSTAVNVSKKGDIINKKAYDGIYFSPGMPVQSDNMFFAATHKDGAEILTRVNKKDLSITEHNLTLITNVLDENYLYNSYNSVNRVGIRKTNLVSKKEKFLELDEPLNAVNAMEISGNSILMICRSEEKYFLYEIDKDELKVKNRISMKGEESMEVSFIYEFFKSENKTYIERTMIEGNTIGKRKHKNDILLYSKKDKKIEIIDMDKEDFGIKTDMKKEDKINFLLSEYKDKNNIYCFLKESELSVLNKKSGRIKKYKIPKKMVKESYRYKFQDIVRDSIYFTKRNIPKNGNIHRYEVIEYNFKKEKITKKIKLENGAKNKNDYLELVDFSVNKDQ